MIDAIRRGEIDVLVVVSPTEEHRGYTLENADRPYRVLIEQMQEGAVTLSEDGTVLYCNQRLASMVGMAQERLIGQALRPLVLPEQQAAFSQLLSDAKHAVVRGELTLCRADGSRLPVYVSLNRLLNDDGALLLCGVLTDLTEQELHLRELGEVNTRLLGEIAGRERVEEALRQSQKMEAVGQLTGGIAHDLNNMLQGITGGITLALMRASVSRDPQSLKFLDLAMTSANRATALTRRLLAFGRRQPLDAQAVHLDDLISSLNDLLQRTVGPEIQIELYLKNGCWPVRCDPNQFENALLNLAINARDAIIPSSGRIRIETGNVTLHAPDTLAWDGAEPGDYVRITVSDTGCGMTPDVLAHAFEPFFTTKPDGQGTGLGLSQLYGFVRQSHGVVRLESQVSTGTSVHLYLPRHEELPDREEKAAATGSARPQEEHGAAATVLLVEDEVTVRAAAAEALRQAGFTVIEAEDGPEGLNALHRLLHRQEGQRLNLLVADIGLPGGSNGRQLADAARSMVSDLPILLITGYAGDALEGKGQLTEGVALLTKPFDLAALTDRVQTLLNAAARA